MLEFHYVVYIQVNTKRYFCRLTSMDEVHRSHVRERDQLGTDIEESSDSIDTCKDRVKGLEERYRFFQEMRGYVRDLVECLNEKVGVTSVSGWALSFCVGGIWPLVLCQPFFM